MVGVGTRIAVGSGVGVLVGVGIAVGTGVGVAVGVGTGVAVGSGVKVGVGSGKEVAVGSSVDATGAVGSRVAVASSVGVTATITVGPAVGAASGTDVGTGCGSSAHAIENASALVVQNIASRYLSTFVKCPSLLARHTSADLWAAILSLDTPPYRVCKPPMRTIAARCAREPVSVAFPPAGRWWRAQRCSTRCPFARR